MNSKIFIIFILILIVSTASVCAVNYGGDLKIKLNLRPFNLNPIYADNETELLINNQIFDTLVVYNNQEEITANLAESWEINPDSTTFKFQLKKYVYFHPYKINGKELRLSERELSAEDWKWSFEYLADPDNKSLYADLFSKVKGYDQYRQGESSEITGIRVKDKYQLEIELKESFAPFIYNLAREAAVVMPAEAVENRELNFSTAPVGTGAFMYHGFFKNKVTLLKNNNYWKNDYQKEIQPYLEQIEINFSADNNLLENIEEFDLYQLNSKEISSYQKDPDKFSDYQLRKFADNNVYFSGFNYQGSLNRDFNNFSLQKSLSQLLQKNDIIKNSGLKSYISPHINSESQKFLRYLSQSLQERINSDFNPASEKIELAINDSKVNIKIAENIKKILEADDFILEIKEYSWTEYINRLNSRNLNSDLFIMSTDYNSQFEFIYNNLYSDSKSNYFAYQNKRLDNLLDYLILVNNKQNTERAFEIIKEIIINDNPFIFLFQGADSYLVSNELVFQDMLRYPNQNYRFELIYFK